MLAIIYSPAKSAAQSGKMQTGYWLLRYVPQKPKLIEPLMGYTSATDMSAEVKLQFNTKQEAVGFAEKNGIPYKIIEPQIIVRRKLSYADNFRADRKLPWTH